MNDWIVRLIEQSSYLGVGFLMFLETVFPPIPSEIIMSVSGLAAARGGSCPSAKRLGDIYDKGLIGVSRDYAESLKWYGFARALGTCEVPAPARR